MTDTKNAPAMSSSRCVSIGIDIGSTAAKAAVIEEGTLRATAVVPTGYNSIDAAKRLASDLYERGYDVDGADARVVATGYGRISVPFAEKTVTEITCHGRGAAFLFGDDATVVDIGGQDTKVIRLAHGKVSKFVMNDKCSAGTGKFLEIMANRLGVTLREMSDLARRGEPTPISSMCTVFAESEVITLVGRGVAREDIACGVIDSVVAKVVPLVSQVGGSDFVLTGGLCEESYVVERLSDALRAPIRTSPQARFAGAIGAALSAL
ncbi:acyl-CoA dehydratase activase [Slackia piriformis]|uniref:acyl-CoA dehydratase activase n=1 Tax=Slackia piriformis TaxID=626934 RepID=UPI0026DD3482|nr:acyl-CoA dehydratase activase [Slackia piriformis]MDO5023248.1 acyl-CoA dehydratase activase [Slackia piriformis]